jgi:hypothetical protein
MRIAILKGSSLWAPLFIPYCVFVLVTYTIYEEDKIMSAQLLLLLGYLVLSHAAYAARWGTPIKWFMIFFTQ